MDDKYFIWDNEIEGLVPRSAKHDEEKTRDTKDKVKIPKSKIYFPYESLNFKYKEPLSFEEQTKYQKDYQRKTPLRFVATDVIMLQDIKNLVIYEITAKIGTDFLEFIHLPITDRFLRALILYMQHYLGVWEELEMKRAAVARTLPNPLESGGRVIHSQELTALRQILAREYADLLQACQPQAKKYHHARGGEISFTKSELLKDLRVFEGLIQVAARVVWIALERKQKDLIELECHRLFRTENFNTAARAYIRNGTDWKVPKDEQWILYGIKMPERKKMVVNSPLPYELLTTDCDHRLLSIGLSKVKYQDPRIVYFQNALLAKEEDLPQLGIKLGILGLLRSKFDFLLNRETSENDDEVIDDTPADEDEGKKPTEYVSLMPPYGSDRELTKPFPIIKVDTQYPGDEKIRNDSKKMWIKYKINGAAKKKLKKKINEL